MDGEITPDEVERLLAEDADVRVVDIRSPGAYERGHIPGSENVPFQELPDRVASLTGSEHIVTVCPHGKASVQAANLITSFEGTTDARVESMAGGLEAWDGELEAGVADADGDAAAADDGPQSPF
ncbi:rhodanese-like domain-containing protein [Halobaculum magnesiiphilum]|uniref:Rhodanese-like domain-containing protein n=1 Tax=Halobaculum magnesiiphilum TaxID=1017351 RepID=A0A8T8W8U4_9EURY|nr:rhodanese-like domain-containing protein [Halobaculum magnesiiphilum]QZP36265.1 rhodanese-like domain-containing protein [Halobaculum magnesiiphilum]